MNRLVRFIKKPSVKSAILVLGALGIGSLLSKIEEFIEITFGSNVGNTSAMVILALICYFSIYSVLRGKKHTKVDWEKFNIDPYSDEDVSKKTFIQEFKKYDGTSEQFVMELDKRFGYSGTMCEINNDDVYSGDPAFDRFEKILSNLHLARSTYENSKAVVDKYQHVNSLKELINRMNWIDEHRDSTIIAIKYGYEVDDD